VPLAGNPAASPFGLAKLTDGSLGPLISKQSERGLAVGYTRLREATKLLRRARNPTVRLLLLSGGAS